MDDEVYLLSARSMSESEQVESTMRSMKQEETGSRRAHNTKPMTTSLKRGKKKLLPSLHLHKSKIAGLQQQQIKKNLNQRNNTGYSSDESKEFTKPSSDTTKASKSVESGESGEKEKMKRDKLKGEKHARDRKKNYRDEDEVSAADQSDQDGSGSLCSEEVFVFETEENQNYARKVTLGLLSRASYREQYWSNKAAAYLAILSYLITYDTIGLLFFYIQQFGIYFMINYTICMLVVGFPMCYLEMALGQYTSTGIYLVFDRMTPAFVGVAVSALILNYLHTCVNHAVIVKSLELLLSSSLTSTATIPWKNCAKYGDDKTCYSYPRNCKSPVYDRDVPRYPIELTFPSHNDLLLLGDTCVRPGTNSIYDAGSEKDSHNSFRAYLSTPLLSYLFREVADFEHWKKISYPSFNHLLIQALISFSSIFILTRDKNSIIKMLKFGLLITATVFAFLLSTLMYNFQPRYPYASAMAKEWDTALVNLKAWACAVDLTLRNLKLGEGSWTFFGSLSSFHNNLLIDCIVLVIVMIFLPFFYALLHTFVIDSYILERSDAAIKVATSAIEIRNEYFYENTFLTVTSLIDALFVFGQYQTVVAYWYILVIALTTICNKIIRLQITISAIVEMNVTLAEYPSSTGVVIVVVAMAMIGQLFSIAENGYFRSTSLLRAVVSISSIILLIFELFVVGVFYGFRLIFSNMSLMMFDEVHIENKIGKLLINTVILVLWTAVIPIVAIFTLIKMIFYFTESKVKQLDRYDISMIFLILLPIPALLLCRIYEQYRNRRSYTPLFKRNPDLWGPRLRSNRSKADKAERMIRKLW